MQSAKRWQRMLLQGRFVHYGGKQRWGEPVTTVQLTPLELLLIGFAAQGIAGFLTNPADVLKTRVQSGSASGVANAFQAAMRDGGPQALMRGAGMRVLWIAPQGCVYYPAYEAAQSFLQRVGL